MTTDSTSPDDKPPAVRVMAAKCARCGAPVQARYRPFCSLRCAEIDLGAWFTERYRVETGESPADAPRQGEEDT
ncbi:MAG: DNA gyrase inhibitor YacG [Rhodospirillaceae bacterium]